MWDEPVDLGGRLHDILQVDSVVAANDKQSPKITRFLGSINPPNLEVDSWVYHGLPWFAMVYHGLPHYKVCV
jgi:hypothetical protein